MDGLRRDREVVVPHTFDTWQDHDSMQEAFIKSRPICIRCGGRVLEDLGIICKQCLEKDKEE